MARFYGSLDGSARTTATRRGTATSGLDSHIRGWTAGVRVVARPLTTGERSAHPDLDAFDIYATAGSSPDGPDILIGTVYRMPGEPVRFEAADIVQDDCGGILADEPEQYDDVSRVVAHMVGDDRDFTFDVDDLTPLGDDDYCAGCGQIGCQWH